MKETLNPNEWIVMNALWERHPATLGEAIAQIGARANWAYKTYQSYMNVLEKKGFVAAEKRGRDKFYAPAVSREACVERERESLLAKLEGRSVKLLLASMVRESDLPEKDYEELKALLEAQLRREAEK